jgi:opacity protein-like surface antigen
VRTPEEHYGWLDTSTQYGTTDPTSTKRSVNTGFSGPPVAAIVPQLPQEEIDTIVQPPPEKDEGISPGVIGLLRMDPEHRGVAGGLGIAVAPLDSLELELAALRSNQWGAYAGARLRFLTGWVRPYVAGGMPAFLYEDENEGMKTKVAFGLRLGGGVELRINSHLSVQGDLGMEYFYNVDADVLVGGKHPETTVFIPTVGVIGRM